VHYQVALQADGGAEATAAVELRNDAPTEGITSYVIGPNVDGAEPGDNRSLLSVYCAAGCEPTVFRRSLGEGELREETELGHPVFTTMVPPGQRGGRACGARLDRRDASAAEEGEGVYRLTRAGPADDPPHALRRRRRRTRGDGDRRHD